MMNTIIVIIAVMILVLQSLFSKKYTPKKGFMIAIVLNALTVVTLGIIQIVTYDNINNSLYVGTSLTPIIVYGVILGGVNYVIYRVIRKK